jgi:hypothetical protein
LEIVSNFSEKFSASVCRVKDRSMSSGNLRVEDGVSKVLRIFRVDGGSKVFRNLQGGWM